jgi:hypothetical protein
MNYFTFLWITAIALFVIGCSHPIDIVGEGDVLSASGNRSCLLEDSVSGRANCSENRVTGDYIETYYAVPRAGWQFQRWANYCTGTARNECHFNIAADTVKQYWGQVMPPLVAIFDREVGTGFNSLFIGHSFFNPFSTGMAAHAARAGFADHQQATIFSGGASGAPQALWQNAQKRTQIQALLDAGDIELFGLTYHPDYPTLEGYKNWVDYALQKNPATRFFIALPWAPNPAGTAAAEYKANWENAHPAIAHTIVDALRSDYPGVDFYCLPYGQAAGELYKLYADGELPEVQALVSKSQDAIYLDSLGHADAIL